MVISAFCSRAKASSRERRIAVQMPHTANDARATDSAMPSAPSQPGTVRASVSDPAAMTTTSGRLTHNGSRQMLATAT